MMMMLFLKWMTIMQHDDVVAEEVKKDSS